MNDKNHPDKKMLKLGIVGSLVAAVCCFTPLLVWGVVGIGLGGLVGGLDYVLFPMLFASLGLVAQAMYLGAGQVGPPPKWIIVTIVAVLSVGLIWSNFRFALGISVAAAGVVGLYWFYLARNSRTSET